jgi:hypothetical protein
MFSRLPSLLHARRTRPVIWLVPCLALSLGILAFLLHRRTVIVLHPAPNTIAGNGAARCAFFHAG